MKNLVPTFEEFINEGYGWPSDNKKKLKKAKVGDFIRFVGDESFFPITAIDKKTITYDKNGEEITNVKKEIINHNMLFIKPKGGDDRYDMDFPEHAVENFEHVKKKLKIDFVVTKDKWDFKIKTKDPKFKDMDFSFDAREYLFTIKDKEGQDFLDDSYHDNPGEWVAGLERFLTGDPSY